MSLGLLVNTKKATKPELKSVSRKISIFSVHSFVEQLEWLRMKFRRNFGIWILAKHNFDDAFQNKLIFTDEVPFLLNNFANKQNCRVCKDEILHVLHKLSKQPEK